MNDFDETGYTNRYKSELDKLSKQYTLRLQEGDYEMVDNELRRVKDILPLHPNHRLIFETILQLNPKSVLDAGCGSGDLSYNIQLLAPSKYVNSWLEKMHVCGCDLLQSQLDLAYQNYSIFELGQFVPIDLTIDLDFDDLYWAHPHFDVVFTQAVLMHIPMPEVLIALNNLLRFANNQVILMENWSDRDYMAAIKSLTDWKDLNFYYRTAPERGYKPHLMIVSKTQLDYPILTDWMILKDTV